jgi:hypothetical protein
MKKISLTLVIVLGLIGVWWLTSHSAPKQGAVENLESTTVPSPEEILANDYEKIAINLKPENISGDEWKQINTYSLKPEKLVTKESAAVYFKTAQANIPDIYSCLKKDFCGMTTRNDNDAYFDDQATPAHILINRNLKIMKESLRKDIALKSQVDWDVLNDLASTGNELLAVEALDIIREFDSESVKTDDLIKLTSDYKGTAKADALARIAKKNGTSDKLLVSREVQNVFADENSDNDTVISVLEQLKNMNFSQDELSRILRNLCRYKDNEAEERNWLMVKSQAKKIYPEFEKLCN